jgi:hypothetical protein
MFKLRGITDDSIKYSLLLTALPRAAFRKIEHLIGDDDDEPAADAYRQLKAALLVSSHVLSELPEGGDVGRQNCSTTC